MCVFACLLDLRDPVPDGVERLLVRHVVHQEDALCASEIGGGDGAEPLLPSRVPDLKLDSLGITGSREKNKRERGGGHPTTSYTGQRGQKAVELRSKATST